MGEAGFLMLHLPLFRFASCFAVRVSDLLLRGATLGNAALALGSRLICTSAPTSTIPAKAATCMEVCAGSTPSHCGLAKHIAARATINHMVPARLQFTAAAILGQRIAIAIPLIIAPPAAQGRMRATSGGSTLHNSVPNRCRVISASQTG